MTNALFFIIGLLLGGCVTAAVLCCLQLERIRHYDRMIRRLQYQLAQTRKDP